jgi:hypothetical protein
MDSFWVVHVEKFLLSQNYIGHNLPYPVLKKTKSLFCSQKNYDQGEEDSKQSESHHEDPG